MAARLVDLTGKRFGRLVVDHVDGFHPVSKRRRMWMCRCDCGNSHRVQGALLRSGAVRSCGCLLAEVGAIAARRKDLVGLRVNMLTVVNRHSGGRWNVRCDCGREHVYRTHALTSGEAKSCGCRARKATRYLTVAATTLAKVWEGNPRMHIEIGVSAVEMRRIVAGKQRPTWARQERLEPYVSQELWYQRAEAS